MAKELKTTVTGGDKITEILRKLGRDAPHAIAAELYMEAERLIADAKMETPVDTGALRASGHVQTPQMNGNMVEVVCGFGGPAVNYALIVHENLENFHPVGKAKYLEDPLNRRIPTMAERIAQGLTKRLAER